MNTKQQLESLDIWLKEAYELGYREASTKLSPENFTIETIFQRIVKFLDGYDTMFNATVGETYFTDGERAYNLREMANKFKLQYGYDEE